jgi:hypothetical protein
MRLVLKLDLKRILCPIQALLQPFSKAGQGSYLLAPVFFGGLLVLVLINQFSKIYA